MSRLKRIPRHLDGLSLVDLAVFKRTEHGIELVELHLSQVEVVQEIARKRAQLVGGLDQLLQYRIRVDFCLLYTSDAADE